MQLLRAPVTREPSTERNSIKSWRETPEKTKPLEPALLEANLPLSLGLITNTFIAFLCNFKAKLFREGSYYFQSKAVRLTLTW